MDRLAIIVPCYNEEEGMLVSYHRLCAVLEKVPNPSEIIYINDGSVDNTRHILDSIAAADPRVRVIHFSRNFGHQPAVTAGIHHCHAELAVIIDADLQDPPELIPDLLAVQKQQYANVVYCVRKSRGGENIFKVVSAKLFYRFFNSMSDVKFPLDTGDFRLIDRKVMDEFCRLKEKGKYIRGLISWIGYKQVPYYYERDARLAGESKYPLSKMIGFASSALFYFSKKPLRIAIALGFIAFFIGLGLGVWFVLGKLLGYTNADSGWTSLITAIIFFGGVQLLTVGVLGQYIGILFDEVKSRPEYIIDETRNFP